MTPSDHQYIEAARELHGGFFVSISYDAEVERTDDGLGAYVTAQLWVERDVALRFFPKFTTVDEVKAAFALLDPAVARITPSHSASHIWKIIHPSLTPFHMGISSEESLLRWANANLTHPSVSIAPADAGDP